MSTRLLTNSIATTNGCSAKGRRYPIVSGKLDSGHSYECGEELYITNCTESICYIGGIGGDNSDKYFGTISKALLKSAQINTIPDCNKLNNNDTDDTQDEVLDDELDTYEEESHEEDLYNNIEDEYVDEEFDDSIIEDENNDAIVDETVEIKKCSNENKTLQRSSMLYNLCFDIDTEFSDFESVVKEHYTCDEKNGYYFDSTYFNPLKDEKCDINNGLCTRTFEVRCLKDSGKAKPIINVTSGIVNSSGNGVISVSATAMQGDIVGYYYSESKVVPTHTDRGWLSDDDGKFTIEHSAGTIYIWVKDSYNNISNAITATVFDTVNSNTTVKQLELKDSNGRVITPSNTVSYNSRISSSKYVMMSNDLRKDSKALAASFNPFDMEYEMEVSSPTVSVYATLTSTDSSYVSGYEPRTVNLNYGLNTVLIKIQNKEGKIRTYTILVNRVDDRNSDNTLSDIKLSVGNIEFNANVTDYKIEIPNNTTNVEVNSTIGSSVASYVSGYEPGSVSITGDTTVKLIKVKSQTGSTRTYVLTFVKKGKDTVSEDSLKLGHLSIPGVYIPFEEGVLNYSISVDYETSFIDIKTTLKDDLSTIKFMSKRKSESDFIESSTSGVLLDVGENFFEIIVKNSKGETVTYRLTIIRKEVGLGISSDNTLKDLKVLGYDIDFKPERKEYTVRIKQEKSLVITAVSNSNRAEVFIRGNEELSGFSTVRIKVVAENGEYETYSIDIKKDPFNKFIEIAAVVVGAIVIIGGSFIIVVKKKSKSNKDYYQE